MERGGENTPRTRPLDSGYEGPKGARARHSAGGDRRLRARKGRNKNRRNQQARENHAPRREGEDRGVLRARRLRAHTQGHDEPRPHRVRRAAAMPPVARTRPDQGGRRPRPALAKGARLQGRNPRRAHAQRHSPADDFRQASRRIRGGLSARRGKYPVAAGLLPRARDKGRRRNPARPADAL